MIFTLTFFSLIISLSLSPSLILLAIIFKSIIISFFFLHYKLFFLFFIWGLVYIGGMMIIFTYIVFFSNYTKTKMNNFSQLVMFCMCVAKKFSFKITTNYTEINNEISFQFTLFGEMGFPLIFVIFSLIGLVLILLLTLLKIVMNQHTQSLSY